MFNLRDAFVRVLQPKAVLAVAKENLDYYDKEIAINRDRFNVGAIVEGRFPARGVAACSIRIGPADSASESAHSQNRSAGVLRDRTPVEQFDVTETSISTSR